MWIFGGVFENETDERGYGHRGTLWILKGGWAMDRMEMEMVQLMAGSIAFGECFSSDFLR